MPGAHSTRNGIRHQLRKITAKVRLLQDLCMVPRGGARIDCHMPRAPRHGQAGESHGFLTIQARGFPGNGKPRIGISRLDECAGIRQSPARRTGAARYSGIRSSCWVLFSTSPEQREVATRIHLSMYTAISIGKGLRKTSIRKPWRYGMR